MTMVYVYRSREDDKPVLVFESTDSFHCNVNAAVRKLAEIGIDVEYGDLGVEFFLVVR